jgi:ssDNA-binding replication factor A large subunit
MLDYRTDGGQCAIYAATATPETVNNNVAGGIDGQNGSVPVLKEPPHNTDPNSSSAPSGSAFPTGGGGPYRENASPDFVTRAANQQQAREIAVQRARTQALKNCLVERGYTEFNLTAEQKAKLATLPQGSDERRIYLHTLGTDAAVLKSQAVHHKSGS